MTSDLPASGFLAAHLDERILAPLRRNAVAARTWFSVTVAFILSLHAAILLALWRHDTAAPAPRKDETAVEVVVEKPKPPPPPAPAPPRQPVKPEIEKPASSAPRAPSDTQVDTAATQKETHAPKAVAPISDGHPSPASPPPAPQADTSEAKEDAAKPDVLQKDAEALDKAIPKPKPKPQKLVKAAAKPRPRHVPNAVKQLAGASELPNYSFAKPTKKSPVSGGTEDSRYLAIVYGMIMMHRDAVAVPGVGNVTVGFNVDDEGHVIGIGIQHSSGDPAIDAAAASAIRRASPFPPPPAGAPHGLVATIDFREASMPAYTMDDRDP